MKLLLRDGRLNRPILIGALAVVLTAAAIVAAMLWLPRSKADALADRPPLPSEPMPAVEPLAFKPVAPEDARAINEAVPFADVPNPAARPFTIAKDDPGLARAVDCLAAATWYEAGDNAEWQRSVAQVVLNRVRHPAFPKSVCGVVFQGSDRVTGCQFTFTCDGALARRPSDAAWERARGIARAALSGGVYAPVGVATHYHTDWVVPYWSSSLLKLAKVGTHLFFRWPGGWGSRGALTGRYTGVEPGVAKLAFLSPGHQALVGTEGVLTPGMTFDVAGTVTPAVQRILFRSEEDFLVLIKPGSAPEALPMMALALCGPQSFCKVRGWTSMASAPSLLPVSSAAQAAMAFSYLRDSGSGFTKALWNCKTFPRADAGECMKGTAPPVRNDALPASAKLPPPAATLRTDLDEKPELIVDTEDGGRRRPGHGG